MTNTDAKCFAADGVTPTYTAPGLPIMVSAVDFNRVYGQLLAATSTMPASGAEVKEGPHLPGACCLQGVCAQSTAEPGQPSSAVGVDEVGGILNVMILYAQQWRDAGGGNHFDQKYIEEARAIRDRLFATKPPEQGRAADVAVPVDLGDIVRRHSFQMASEYHFSDIGLSQFVKELLTTQPPASPVAVPEGLIDVIDMLNDLDDRLFDMINRQVDAGDIADTLAELRRIVEKLEEVRTPTATQTPLQPLADSRGSDEVGV